MLRIGDPWVAAHTVDGDPRSARVVSCRRCNERLGKRGVYPALARAGGSADRISIVGGVSLTRSTDREKHS